MVYVIKTVFNDSIRRFTNVVKFEDLVKKTLERYEIAGKALKFVYKDEEGDLISVSRTSELEEAFDLICKQQNKKSLKLFVSLDSNKQNVQKVEEKKVQPKKVQPKKEEPKQEQPVNVEAKKLNNLIDAVKTKVLSNLKANDDVKIEVDLENIENIKDIQQCFVDVIVDGVVIDQIPCNGLVPHLAIQERIKQAEEQRKEELKKLKQQEEKKRKEEERKRKEEERKRKEEERKKMIAAENLKFEQACKDIVRTKMAISEIQKTLGEKRVILKDAQRIKKRIVKKREARRVGDAKKIKKNADKLAKKKAEKAKEQAEKLAKKKAEEAKEQADKLAQQKADKLAKKKAEEAKEQADKLAKKKADEQAKKKEESKSEEYKQLLNMGFDKSKIDDALKKAKGSLQNAVIILLG